MLDASFKEQSQEDRELVEKSKHLISDAYNGARKKFHERKKYWDFYYVNDPKYKTKKLDHQAQFLSPQFSADLEKKISLYAQGTTGTDIQPFYIFQGLGNDYATRAGQALTRMAYTDLMNDCYYDTNYLTSQHYTVEGMGIEKPWWTLTLKDHYPQAEEKTFVDDFGNVDVQMIQPDPIKVIDKNHLTVKSIAPNDLWLDPSARNEDQLRYGVERHIVPFSLLKDGERMGIYRNVDMIKDTKMPIRTTQEDFFASVAHERKDYHEFYETQTGNKAIDKEDPFVEVLVVYRPGYQYAIANDRILIMSPISLPWIKERFPWEFYNNYPSNFRFDGLPEMFFSRWLIKELNKVGNMFIDNISKHLNPTTFINGLIAPEDIAKIRSGEPNVVVESVSADLIQQFRPELPSNAVVALLDRMAATEKDSMGVTEPFGGQGNVSSALRTTGSLQLATQLGNIRSSVKLQMLANKKRKTALRILDIYRHFITDEKAIPMAGGLAPEVSHLKRDDLELDYVIDTQIAPAADILRSQELQAMRAIFADFGQFPFTRTENMARQIIHKTGLFTDAAGLIIDPTKPGAQEEINMRNNLYAQQMKTTPNPQFAGSVAVQSPDAGGQGNVSPAQQQGGQTPTQQSAAPQ